MLRPLAAVLFAVIAAVTAAISPPAIAQEPLFGVIAEVEFGIGYDAFDDDDFDEDVAFGIDLRSVPVLDFTYLQVGIGLGTEFDSDGDFFFGGGPYAAVPFGSTGLRLIGSFFPGAYAAGNSGDDLGSTLMFRSRIGLDYAITERISIGAAFEHKSNAGIEDENPGVNTAFATVALRF